VRLDEDPRRDAREPSLEGGAPGGEPSPHVRSRRKIGARAQLFAAAVCFGLMAALVRFGSRGPAGFSAAQMSTVRFTVGIGLTLGLFWLRPGTFRPVRRWLLFTRGALGGIAVLLYFVALSRIPAGEATLLNNTFPVIATVLSFYTLGERPTVHIALALVVVSAGVFLVVGPGSPSLGLGLGALAGIASAVLGAGAVTSIRALRATDNAPTIFFAFCLGGLAVSAPFSFGSWPAGAATWALAGAIGVLSFIAQLLMTHAYGALTIAEAAIWQQLTPIASYAWALALLDERLSRLGSLGVLLGIAGVAYGSILGHRPVGGRAGTTVVVEPVDPA
jgi:drug/metabolite transporter (DMT)-like permease